MMKFLNSYFIVASLTALLILSISKLENMNNAIYIDSYFTTFPSLLIPFAFFIRNFIAELYGYIEYKKFVGYYFLFALIIIIRVLEKYYSQRGLVLVCAICVSIIFSKVINLWWVNLFKSLLNGSQSPFKLNKLGVSILQIVFFTIFFNSVIFSYFTYANVCISKIIIDSTLLNILLCLPLFFMSELLLVGIKLVIIHNSKPVSNKKCLFKLIEDRLIDMRKT